MAEIFAAHGEAYRAQYPLTAQQRKVMAHLCACRTAALGGRLDVCQHCGHQQLVYQSCRDRHCPSCQCLRQAAWIQTRLSRTLPTHYFHVVFTLPAELRGLAQHNPTELYTLLFSAVADTLHGFAQQFIGGQIGFTSVLHTWNRQLGHHPHIHCIVTGGALSADQTHWFAAKKRFLFPQTKLASVFRAKFVAGLRALYRARKLDLPGRLHALTDEAAFAAFVDRLFEKQWLVYAKRPFGGPRQVFSYLGRYVHRVAISNQRLLSVKDDAVTFLTKDGNRITLPPLKFIRHFLLHVLPAGFVKIRHYGLLAPANVNSKLLRARQLLLLPRRSLPLPLMLTALILIACSARPPSTSIPLGLPAAVPLCWREQFLRLTGVDLNRCPRCGRAELVSYTVARGRPAPWDTS